MSVLVAQVVSSVVVFHAVHRAHAMLFFGSVAHKDSLRVRDHSLQVPVLLNKVSRSTRISDILMQVSTIRNAYKLLTVKLGRN